MMRRNHSTIRRTRPNFLVLLISVSLILAIGALLFWPKPKAKTIQLTKKPVLRRATKQNVVDKASQPVNPKQKSKGLQGFSGKIIGPLPHSLRRGLEREKAKFLSALAARILIWKLDLRRDLRKNDHIRILFSDIDEQSKYQIEAMTYHSLKHGKTFRFYRFKGARQKFAAYYDRTGHNVELKLHNTPIREYEQVTSILKMRRRHKGVDFKAPVGTKIYLPWRARVLRINWNLRFNGKSIKVRFLHGKHLHGIFLHLHKIMPVVRKGAVLRANTVIAEVGNTGHSTAAHLHYQLQNRHKKIYDPFKVHRTYTISLSKRDMPAFTARCHLLDDKLAAIK